MPLIIEDKCVQAGAYRETQKEGGETEGMGANIDKNEVFL